MNFGSLDSHKKAKMMKQISTATSAYLNTVMTTRYNAVIYLYRTSKDRDPYTAAE